MPKHSIASVREVVEGNDQHQRGRVVRIKLRLDLWLDEQSLEWSLIAWEHPEARIIRNEVSGWLGFLFLNQAVDEVNQALCSVIDDYTDPFPDAPLPPSA